MSQIRTMLMAHAGVESLSAEEVDQVEAIAEKTAEEVAELVADKAAEEVKEEVNDLADEVEELSEEVEDIEDDVEELEETVEGLEAMLVAGNYNAAAFGILYNRADKLNRRLGGKDTGAVVGAESLGDATSAGLAARAGLEGFTETVKGYKDAAVKFIMAMYESIKNYIKGLLDKSVALQNQVKATKARLDKTEELKKDVKPGKWASLAKIDRVSKLREVMVAANKVVESTPKLAENDLSSFKSAMSNLTAKAKELGSLDQSKSTKAGDKETILVKIGVVALTVTVYTGSIENHDDIKKACKATSLSYSVTKAEGEVQFPALDKPKASKMLEQVERMAKEMAEYKNDRAANDEGRDKLISAVKKLEGDDKEWAKPAVASIKAATAMTNKVYTVGARVLGNIADAKLSAVKAYL